jgi:hypothetical protein
VVRDAPPQTPGWRELLPLVIFGGALVALELLMISFAGRGVTHSNEFRTEAWPAYRALGEGHPLGFLRLAPAYVGSLVLRAPFAAVALALGAGWRMTYFASALPCLLAGVLFGAWLLRQPVPSPGRGIASRISPAILCALNPAVIVGLGDGHPEQVLGAVLCAAAVVLALSGKARLAGVLVGLAVINEAWAIAVVPVVLVALPADRRRALLATVVTAAAVLVPVYLARVTPSLASGAATFGSQTGGIFLYPQLLWWFGRGAWVVREAHILLVVVCVMCTGLWWATRGRSPSAASPSERRTQVLTLLCLVLLLRAALDPWDNYYYHVPFLFALMTLEARRPPILTITCSIVLLIVVPLHVLGGSGNFEAAAYAVVAVPMIAWLALRAFGGAGAWRRLRAPRMPAVPKTAGRTAG